MKRGFGLLATLVAGLLILAAPKAWTQQASRISETTAAIAQGEGSAGRRAVILRHLEATGIAHQETEFVDPRMRRGTNILTTVPGNGAASKTLLLGAHYDRVPEGQGVVDNGASCAVLLHLLEAFKSRPLRNHELKVAFFDLEEGGLNGSRAFFADLRAKGGTLPAYAVNLDIFGYGDTFFAAASNPAGVLAGALQRSGAQGGPPVRMVPPPQYPPSDHVNMIAAGIETLAVALIDGKEVDSIVDIQQLATAPPRILTLIHTPGDTMEAFRAAEVERGAAALERFIRLLDEP